MSVTTDNSTAGTPVQALSRRVLLLNPSLGWWKAHYQLRDAEVAVTVGDSRTVVAHNLTTPPHVKLWESSDWTRERQKTFQTLDSTLRRTVETFSLPFPIRGVRIVPKEAAEEFLDALLGPQGIGAELAREAERLCEQYDRLLQEICQNQSPAVWRLVAGRIPSRTELRRKFYLDVAPLELQGGGETQEVSREGLRGYAAQMRAATQRLVDQTVEAMVAEPRRELAAALTQLHDLIQRDGRVTSRSFNAARDAFQKLEMFRFVATDDLLARAEEIRCRLADLDPATVTAESAAQNGLLTALQSVSREIADEASLAQDVQTAGRRMRALF